MESESGPPIMPHHVPTKLTQKTQKVYVIVYQELSLFLRNYRYLLLRKTIFWSLLCE